MLPIAQGTSRVASLFEVHEAYTLTNGEQIHMPQDHSSSNEQPVWKAAKKNSSLKRQMKQPMIPQVVRGLAAIGQQNTKHQDQTKTEWLFREDASSIQQHPAWPLASAGAGREQNWLEKTFGYPEDVLMDILAKEPPPTITSCGEIKEIVPHNVQDMESAVKLSIVQGIGVNDLHRTPLGQNAILQVASQFDFQESVGAYDTPVSKYVTDKTQGAQAAIEAAAAALHRKAAKKNGTLPHALSDILTKAIQQKYPDLYKDGYLDLTVITNEKDKSYLLNVIEKRIDKLKVLPQWALCETSGAQQLQVFCAAPSFEKSIRPDPGSIDNRICKKLVVAQYIATAQLAVIRSKELNEPVPLHLTLVGQGAFKNDPSVMKEAFEAIAQVVQGTQVNVYAHAYSADNQHLLQTQLADAEQQGKISLTTMSAHQFRQAQHPGQPLTENLNNVNKAYRAAKNKIPKSANLIPSIREDRKKVLVDVPDLTEKQLNAVKSLTETERMVLDEINKMKTKYWPSGITKEQKIDLLKKIQPLINNRALCQLLVKDEIASNHFFSEFNFKEKNLDDAVTQFIRETMPKSLSVGQAGELIKRFVETFNHQNNTTHHVDNVTESYSNLLWLDSEINGKYKDELDENQKNQKIDEFKQKESNPFLIETADELINTPIPYAPEGAEYQHIQMAYTMLPTPPRAQSHDVDISKNPIEQQKIDEAIEYLKEMKELMDDLKDRHALVRYQAGTDFEGYGENWRQSDLNKWLEKEEHAEHLDKIHSFDDKLMTLLGDNFSDFSNAFGSFIRGNLDTRERVVSETGRRELENYLKKNPQVVEHIITHARDLTAVNEAFIQHVKENVIREPRLPMQEAEKIKNLKDMLASKLTLLESLQDSSFAKMREPVERRAKELQAEIQQLEVEYETKNTQSINPETAIDTVDQQEVINAFQQFCLDIASTHRVSADDIHQINNQIPDDNPHSKLKSAINSLSNTMDVQQDLVDSLVNSKVIFVDKDTQTYQYVPANIDAHCCQTIIDYHAALLKCNEEIQDYSTSSDSISNDTLIALNETLSNFGYSSTNHFFAENSLKAEQLFEQMQQIHPYVSTEPFSNMLDQMKLDIAITDLAVQRKSKALEECTISPLLLSNTTETLINNFIDSQPIYLIEQNKVVEYQDDDLLTYIHQNISADEIIQTIQAEYEEKYMNLSDKQPMNAYLDKAFYKFAELINHNPEQQYAQNITQSDSYQNFLDISKNSSRFNIIEKALATREASLSHPPQENTNVSKTDPIKDKDVDTSAVMSGSKTPTPESNIENVDKKKSARSNLVSSFTQYFSKRKANRKQKKIERQEQIQALDTIFNDIRNCQERIVACNNINDTKNMYQAIDTLHEQIQKVSQSKPYHRSTTIKQQVEVAKIRVMDLSNLAGKKEHDLKKVDKRKSLTPLNKQIKETLASSKSKKNKQQTRPIKNSKHRNK